MTIVATRAIATIHRLRAVDDINLHLPTFSILDLLPACLTQFYTQRNLPARTWEAPSPRLCAKQHARPQPRFVTQPFCYNARAEAGRNMRSLDKLRVLGLLWLRIALGVIFFYHGYQKLFVAPATAIQAFARLGFPSYFVYLAGTLELFGAILLVIGLFTRVTALLLAV
jgi:hypothetical protein